MIIPQRDWPDFAHPVSQFACLTQGRRGRLLSGTISFAPKMQRSKRFEKKLESMAHRDHRGRKPAAFLHCVGWIRGRKMAPRLGRQRGQSELGGHSWLNSVSYTHLTLPTKRI